MPSLCDGGDVADLAPVEVPDITVTDGSAYTTPRRVRVSLLPSELKPSERSPPDGASDHETRRALHHLPVLVQLIPSVLG